MMSKRFDNMRKDVSYLFYLQEVERVKNEINYELMNEERNIDIEYIEELLDQLNNQRDLLDRISTLKDLLDGSSNFTKEN